MAPDPTREFAQFRTTGDPAALARVFDVTAVELMRVASHLVTAADAAEDLVQSTFLTAIEQREKFEPGRPVLPWLLGILTNHARRHRVAARRKPDPERVRQLGRVPGDEAAAGDEVAEQELTRSILDAIEGLPEPYRPVLRLHLRRGLAPQEIAVDLDRPPATIRKQLQRGLERLRGALPAALPIGAAVTVASTAAPMAAMRARVLERAGQVTRVTAPGVGLLATHKLVGLIAAVCVVASVLIVRSMAAESTPVPVVGAVGASDTEVQPVTDIVEEGEPARAAVTSPVAVAASDSDSEAVELTTLVLRGRVLSISGAGIEGASVFLSKKGSRDVGRVVATTDVAGVFEVPDAVIGSWVSAFATGYAPCAIQPVDGDPGAVFELDLELNFPARAIGGVVLDPAGSPVHGARIMVGQRAGPGGWMGSKRISSPPPLWLETDERGRFESKSAPVRGELAVYAEGFAPWKKSSGDLGEPATDLVVRLHEGGVVEGRVLDEAGAPLTGVTVAVWSRGAPPWEDQRVRVEEDGTFRLAALRPGKQFFFAYSKGYETARGEFEIEDRAVTAWNPVLQRSPRIVGRVVDERGAGLAGYHVRAYSNTREGPVTTDATGAFEITGCGDPEYELRVSHPDDALGLWLVQVPGIVPNSGDNLVTLLPADRAVGGVRAQLQTDAGAPLGRVEYSLWRRPFEGGWNLHSEAHTGVVSHPTLPPDRYRIDVRVPGYAKFEHEFEVRAGAVVDLGGLRMERPGQIEVTVTRRGGAPMPRGTVEIIAEDGELHVGHIDIQAGSGTSEPLERGRYRLRGGASWFAEVESPVDVVPGGTARVHLEVDVVAQRTVRFESTDASRALELELSWRDAAGRELRKTNAAWMPGQDAQRSWWFGVGSYRLEATSSTGETGAVEFEIHASGAEAVPLTLSLR